MIECGFQICRSGLCLLTKQRKALQSTVLHCFGINIPYKPYRSLLPDQLSQVSLPERWRRPITALSLADRWSAPRASRIVFFWPARSRDFLATPGRGPFEHVLYHDMPSETNLPHLPCMYGLVMVHRGSGRPASPRPCCPTVVLPARNRPSADDYYLNGPRLPSPVVTFIIESS